MACPSHYSLILLSSMIAHEAYDLSCAIGALFDSQLPRPRQRADTFAKMAKALLENELESPKVATVQALVILSSFEAGATRESRAWLFSGS